MSLLEKEDFDIGGSIFWIVTILIALSGLVYFMIWSFHNNSVKGAIVSIIFIGMIISGILLSRMKVFDWASWGDNALSFTLGFWIWIAIGSLFSTQSILSVSQNHLFATISSELPQFVEFITNIFIVPIAEELFWMVGIPFALITIFRQLGKQYDIWNNVYLQMAIIIFVGSTTFAFFHVGKLFIGFIIASMIFRTIMIVLIYGEYNFDILKGVNLVAGFSVGAHIGNNLIDYGFSKAWIVLKSELVVMIIILLFFGALFITALNRMLEVIVGKRKNLEDMN